jgi:hypothetical protein
MEHRIEDIQKMVDELMEDFPLLESDIYTLFQSVEVEQEFGFGNTKWVLDPSAQDFRRGITRRYEAWYNGIHPLIEKYLPDRRERLDKADTAIRRRMQMVEKEATPIDSADRITDALHIQRGMLEAVIVRVRSERLVNPREMSREVVTKELRQADELLGEDIDRAAGVLAGVALERHLAVMCESASEDVDYHPSDNLASLAQSLYEADVIENSDLSHLEHLSKLRNKCAHADTSEPSRDEVERLVEQADDFISRHV